MFYPLIRLCLSSFLRNGAPLPLRGEGRGQLDGEDLEFTCNEADRLLGAPLFFGGGFQPFRVLRNLQLIQQLLDVAVHEHRQIVHRVVDAVVGHAGLRVVVGADFRGAIAR